MQYAKLLFKDRMVVSGMVLLSASLFIFLFPQLLPEKAVDHFGFFTVNFLLAITYWLALVIKRRERLKQNRAYHPVLSLLLFLVSAYALNMEMNVFDASASWLCWLIGSIGAVCIAAAFFHYLPQAVKYAVLFGLGLAFIFFLYLAVYLLPLYAISFVGLLFFGIAVHTFIPLLFCVHLVILVRTFAHRTRKYYAAFISGIVITLLVITAFCTVWQSNTRNLNKALERSLAESDSALPAWITVARSLPITGITEKILKTDLVYVVPGNGNNSLFWRMPAANGEGKLIHDPLVVIAHFFSDPLHLDAQARLAVLKTRFDGHHLAEERLWSGKDLRTRSVSTNVRIWPEYRLSFTEKIITVFNHDAVKWATNQEAIYTFQLPAGAVVTSLSLWVDGVEEKGILTTQGKADSAYKTIVGVENRDPSVVHWLEGSRVSVRVFPVTAGSSRVFKIGVTAPMRREGNNLVYDNIHFKGPDASGATETMRAWVNGNVNEHAMKTIVAANGRGSDGAYSGKYRTHWKWTVPVQPLATNSFVFNGYAYSLAPYQKVFEQVLTTDVYLDINSSWTKKEFDAVVHAANGKRLWVYDNEPVLLTASNKDVYFKALVEHQFSLFPLFIIKDPATALLVSKSGTATPNLADIRTSVFYASLKTYRRAHGKIRLFHLSPQPSGYLSTLRDYRYFQYDAGDTTELIRLLRTGTFLKEEESETATRLHEAALTIVKDSVKEQPAGAPDHLFRLFAYNHLLQQYGKDGPDTDGIEEQLVPEAERANIVTPVSSLIVLESQRDYDRFGIKRNDDALQNATLKSKGAVPEPHEWLLICLAGIAAIYLWVQRKTACRQ